MSSQKVMGEVASGVWLSIEPITMLYKYLKKRFSGKVVNNESKL